MKKLLPLILLIIAFTACQQVEKPNVIEQSLNQGWTLTGDTLDINMQVDVPSVVQQSLYENGIIPHPYLGTVENQLLWISDHPWDYSLHFDVDKEMLENYCVELVFEGLDTYADVKLNGEKLFFADNQFRSWKQWVNDYLKEKDNLLEVHFPRYDSTQLALYEQHQPRLPEKYAVTRKAPYQHGWDWAPKYKNVGIWKPVKLVARKWNSAWLEDAYTVTKAADADSANLWLYFFAYCDRFRALAEVEITVDQQKTYQFEVELREGNQGIYLPITIEHPRLWWPNEMGEQPLYDFELKLKLDGEVVDSRSFRSGIRTFEMVDEPDSIGRAFYFKVNGVPFYAKGANYVPEEMIETWINPDNTLKLLRQAKDAHFNMLRIWGGGIYPSDDFFNICDSLGILVWEDFMYAGTMYPYDEAFFENARIEAEEQVKRLASHPSLALWCGGNEVSEGYYNWGWQKSLNWSEEDDKAIKAGYDRLFESLLPQVVEKFDGTRPYWPSSPSKGWGRPESLTQGDVHYWGVWWGELPYEVYREKVGRFNSEYGYQSYPDYSTLQKIAQDEPLSKDAEVIAAHQKHARGTRQIDDFIQRYYPDAQPKDFEEYVHLSQLSQAYGMEIAIEAHRTAKPYNMGTLYWQLNDAWPVTSWSSIDYYGRPKVLQERLKTLFVPVLLSLDQKDYGVFVTSDLLRDINGELTVKVCDFEDLKSDELEDHPKFEQKLKVEMKANENRKYVVEGLGDYLRNADLQKVYVKLELTEGDTLTAERKCYFHAVANL
ncbi:MAG: glycoside hydrolase family 2 protein [Bacteroidales bacterium]|nr:glycoside hydrolase family 2 protein [Bacteroidales bacterium]